MDLTISSVLTTCILTSLVIVLLGLLFKRGFVLKKIGPHCMIIVFMAIIIRMFFPFEFPYTYSWYIEDVFTPFRRIFTYVILESPMTIKVWNVLIIIWIIGVICEAIRRVYVYKKITRCVSLLPEESWNEIAEKYELDLEKYNDFKRMKVVYFNQVESPYLFGLKKLTLVLPQKKYEKEKFHYIILHEFMHAKNKDIVWKVLIDVLCIAFWWNPVFLYLKKEMFQLLEMRNDMQILSLLSEKEKINYMKCLKDVAIQLTEKDINFAVGFSRGNLKELNRRMDLIAHFKKFARFPQLLLCTSAFILLLLTSTVVVEPYSYDQEDEGTAMTENNTYLIRNGDQYDVYMDGTYIFKTDDLTPFENVKIYDNLEEVNLND